MKYIVLLGDGMADYPVPALDGKTPLEVANIPTFDWLAQHGETGLVQSIPEGMAPGSDVANLGVMGYDPARYYSGRSPLEAVSLGIELGPNDVAYRCNLITLEGEGALEERIIVDHSSGEITTAEAHELVEALNEALDFDGAELYPGTSYRHCLVIRNGKTGADCTPPHDVVGDKAGLHLPKEQNSELLLRITKESIKVLEDHPINKRRIAEGKNPASCCWFWGEGTRPALTSFEELYHVGGGVISAVDLLKGIALCAGLKAPEVEGATGTLDTNYAGKLDAAMDILDNDDFVYMHFEGPDECGHQANEKDKILAIERLDELVLLPLMKRLKERGWDYNILLMPDHATPIVVRTHTSDPIPYVLYKSTEDIGPHAAAYTEAAAKATGKVMSAAHELIPRLLNQAE